MYPTQGTRPVFSSVHLIFSGPLIDISFWCLENDIKDVELFMSEDVKFLVANNRYNPFEILD